MWSKSNLKRSVIGVLVVSVITCAVDAGEIAAPQCPVSFTVKNGQVIDAPGWEFNLDTRFKTNPARYKLEDGARKTTGKAPSISEINDYSKSVSGGVSPDDERYEKNVEHFTWKRPNNFENGRAVFVCDSEALDIFLFKRVPSDVKLCTKTFFLKKGERSWADQELKCWTEESPRQTTLNVDSAKN